MAGYSKQNVVALGYSSPWVCTQCGVCAAMCPTDAIQMDPDQAGYTYPVIDEQTCVDCGLCARVCPGPRVTYQDGGTPSPALGRQIYGPFRRAILAYAENESVRWQATSGGFVTALLLSLLRQDVVSGAVVTDLGGEGCTTRTFLARKSEEIHAACGSKYMVSSHTGALRSILSATDGPFAVVGLPCQIEGYRRAMAANKELREKVFVCVGLFCGSAKDRRYQAWLLRKMGLREREIEHFAFRGEGWPGLVTARDKAGKSSSLGSADAQVGRLWSWSVFTPPRCLLCDDPLGASADVVVGDPWHLDYAKDEKGNSLVLIRTQSGADAVGLSVEGGDTVVKQQVPISDLAISQEGILWRRYYASARIKVASLWARGWKGTARNLPGPSAMNTLKALRAFILSRSGSFCSKFLLRH